MKALKRTVCQLAVLAGILILLPVFTGRSCDGKTSAERERERAQRQKDFAEAVVAIQAYKEAKLNGDIIEAESQALFAYTSFSLAGDQENSQRWEAIYRQEKILADLKRKRDH